jgi:hypothetical protein
MSLGRYVPVKPMGDERGGTITIYAPMIYTAPCVMVLMRADTYVGKWGGGGGFGGEKENFFGHI